MTLFLLTLLMVAVVLGFAHNRQYLGLRNGGNMFLIPVRGRKYRGRGRGKRMAVTGVGYSRVTFYDDGLAVIKYSRLHSVFSGKFTV